MAMEALGDFNGPGLEQLLAANHAEFIETNEAGGAVYKARVDNSVLVVYARPGGVYRVTRIPDACNC